jgi:hypothetical protein
VKCKADTNSIEVIRDKAEKSFCDVFIGYAIAWPTAKVVHKKRYTDILYLCDEGCERW